MANDERAVTTLPDRDDMMRRLKSVLDTPAVVQGFYPSILTYAGKKKTGAGVVLMLYLAIKDFTSAPQGTKAALRENIDRFITALIDDEETLSDAREARRAVIREQS